MNETDIRKYAGLMQELGLTGLEITEDNKVVRLERTLPAPVREITAVNAGENGVLPKNQEEGDYISVKSGIVGVFYAAPGPDQAPFVEVGKRVKKGDVLCIIEAMKLMNEITAEFDGEVVDICVHNGDVVEYGQTLFKLC